MPDSNDIDELEDLHGEDSAGGANEGKGRSRTGLRPCASFTTLERPRMFSLHNAFGFSDRGHPLVLLLTLLVTLLLQNVLLILIYRIL